MGNNEETSLHPVVRQMLESLRVLDAGPGLSNADFERYTREIVGHADAKTIAVHLLALAKRFYDEKAMYFASQLMVLAQNAIGSTVLRPTDEALDAAARKLAAKNAPSGPNASPTAGLAPPSGGALKRK